MTTCLAFALILMTAPDESETPALIARLGSPRQTERDAASAALEAKGRAALHALRAASRESPDAEVRSRAAELRAKVEHDILTRPTMVTLNVRDQAVGEAIKELCAKNHFAAMANIEESQGDLRHKVTLHGEGPIPLLAALDRLCATGGMRWLGAGSLSDGEQPLQPPSPGSVELRLIGGAILGPHVDHGPFRVKIREIEYIHRRSRSLERHENADEFVSFEDTRVEMQVFAEPRMRVKLVGLKFLEAVDDQGRSLAEEPELTLQDVYGYASSLVLPQISA